MNKAVRGSWIVARVVAVVTIGLAGIASILGSGGGGDACFPFPCPPDPGPRPPMVAVVEPSRITVQVGDSVTFTVRATWFEGAAEYQWLRSDDGGRRFEPLPGATGATYVLAAATLADDGAVFSVDVRPSGAVAPDFVEAGRLAVASAPGVLIEDSDFKPTDWVSTATANAQMVTSDERVESGGYPDAYRRSTFEAVGEGAWVGVVNLYERASYDAAENGAIYVIDFRFDCALERGSSTVTSLVVEQDGRLYESVARRVCTGASWGNAARGASLTPADFRQLAGPSCASEQPCSLDFSANASALRFGYRLEAGSGPGYPVVIGVDNWKVTVWRR